MAVGVTSRRKLSRNLREPLMPDKRVVVGGDQYALHRIAAAAAAKAKRLWPDVIGEVLAS